MISYFHVYCRPCSQLNKPLDNFNLLQSSTDQLENSPQCQCRCRCRVVNANYRSATSWGGRERGF